MSDAWIGLLGGLIGGALSLIGAFGLASYQHRRRAKAVTMAIRAEIDALLKIVETRDYVTQLAEWEMEWRSGIHTTRTISVKREYFSIFKSNSSGVGLLPPSSVGHVVEFYTLAMGFIEDCDTWSETVKESPDGPWLINEENIAETRTVLEKAVAAGKQAVSAIDNHYRSACTG